MKRVKRYGVSILLASAGTGLFAQNTDSLFQAMKKQVLEDSIAYANAHAFDYSNCDLLDKDVMFQLDRNLNYQYENFHSAIKPYVAAPFAEDEGKRIELRPLAGFRSTYDASAKKYFTEKSIGPELHMNFSEKLSASFTFLAGSSAYPHYIDTLIKTTDVVPGLGTAYGAGKYSYQYYSGYVSYSPNHIFNFQFGKDKHFWGDGYRSLFLSDVSNSYPYFQSSVTVWKIKYVSLFAWMKDNSLSHFKKDYRDKFGTFHYLSWNVTKRLNIGLFEAVIWQGSDTNRVRGFDVNYLDPIIFFRPVEYSLGSSDNVGIGMSTKVKIGKRHQLYGQVFLDEFLLKEVLARNGWWGNKQAVQIGWKWFDVLGVKDLSARTEFNKVRPYTYSHGSVQQSYGNYNQPLAHPFGANFWESVSFLTYRHKKLLYEGELLLAAIGRNENGFNWGNNIFVSYSSRPQDYNNVTTQGLTTTLVYAAGNIAFFPFGGNWLRFEIGGSIRMESNSKADNKDLFIHFGIRTTLPNFYRDL